jgi:hypothetical protein
MLPTRDVQIDLAAPSGWSGGGSYDVTPDGQRFLVLEPVEQEAVTHLNVVLNWFDELRQRMARLQRLRLGDVRHTRQTAWRRRS